MLIVTRDGWVFERAFEDNERAEAEKYRDRCDALYQGSYSVAKMSDEDFAAGLRRYTRIIGEEK